MKCLILGAGYATRLYPLTKDRPKPLLPVGGVPILERICEQVFKVKDIDAVHIVTNHKFASHYWKWLHDYQQRRSLPVPIDIFDDMTMTPEDRLGAIGDTQFVIKHAGIDDDLLLIAGDNLLLFPLQGFVDQARAKGTSVCLKDLGDKKLVSLYGAVSVDGSGKVVGFEEKPPQPKTTLVSIGAYVFARAHIPLFKKFLDQGQGKDAPGYYLQWLHRQIDVYGYVLEGDWYDIGDLESYNRANEMMTESTRS